MKKIIAIIFFLQGLFLYSQDVILQAETMNLSGPYSGVITNPFDGVGFYGNGDKASDNISLSTVPGQYKIDITGASSSNSDAKIDVYIAGTKLGTVNFDSNAATTQTIEVIIDGANSDLLLELVLSTDNGSNDTFVDVITLTYIGVPPPPRDPPVIPSTPSFDSNIYRNMFVESGLSEAEVSQKLEQIWNQYFVDGDLNNERLYYEVDNDMAYILDTGNNDIRSEGMSYGMMICLQLDKKEEFDKLWKFAKAHSQHDPGTDREGLFSWQLNRDSYSMMDPNSAPDGEEYFVTALFFADARWGSDTNSGNFDSETDIFDYRGQANYILDSMLNKPDASSGACPTDLIDVDQKQVVFGICGESAKHTDPSYHLPAFYEIWALYADNNNQLWADMAETSRTYLLPAAAHPTTGLMPDYSEFDGTPKATGTHANFEFDAWRNIMNMGFDFAWFQKSGDDIQPLIDRQIDFFKDKPGYPGLWTLDGTARNSDHNPGLVACNAVGSLALEDAKVWPFIDELLETGIPSGQYRYYDGLLYMMSFMHLAGEFKAYKPQVLSVSENDIENTITVFPNPSNGSFHIKGMSNDKIYQVKLYDLSGRLVFERKDLSDELITIKDLSSGLYLVKVNSNTKEIVKRLIVN